MTSLRIEKCPRRLTLVKKEIQSYVEYVWIEKRDASLPCAW